ncbi:MAG TPA: hypothetical protein ENJ88_02595 [Phaeodactylibacter sp.]|nr:hypothetical protein [Phaeodactylibacter sp.]
MRMLREEDLVEIGQTGKTYGREGALKLRVEEFYLPYLLQTRFAFVKLDGGFVPYAIEWVELTEPPRLKLAIFNSPEEALRLVARPLALLRKDVPLTALPSAGLRYGFLKDFELHGKREGTIGLIAEVRKYPRQEMAVLLRGKDREELLIPLHEQLIVEIDKPNRKVLMDLPEGLVGELTVDG